MFSTPLSTKELSTKEPIEIVDSENHFAQYFSVEKSGDKNNKNNKMHCLKCNKTFQGSLTRMQYHILGSNKSQVAACTSTSLDVREERRRNESSCLSRKRDSSQLGVQESWQKAERHHGNGDIDKKLLAFLAENDLAPRITESESFRDLLTTCARIGYIANNPQILVTVSKRSAFGLNGTVLSEQLKFIKDEIQSEVGKLSDFGNTLCSDGAKNCRRNALNTVIVSCAGVFFVQSTDCSSVLKKNADYLKSDIDNAITHIGAHSVFAVCMDGACRSTLKLIDETYPRIFGQRCATHGFSLLHKDVAKFFVERTSVIKWTLQVVKLFLSHNVLGSKLTEAGGKALQTPVDTRYGSLLQCAELVLKDKLSIISVLFNAETQEWIRGQRQPIKDSVSEVIENVCLNAVYWQQLQVFISVELPIRIALRVTDTDKPNMIFTAEAFENARKSSVAHARDAETKESNEKATDECIWTGLEAFVVAQFDKRKVDCVSMLAQAAAMIVPGYFFEKNPADVQFSCPGGDEAMEYVLSKYYSVGKNAPADEQQSAAQNIFRAQQEYFNFRNHFRNNFWYSELTFIQASNHSKDVDILENVVSFWQLSKARSSTRLFAEVALKIATSFAGQGASERCNKDVNRIRSKVRNRQSHEVTSAYLTLKSYYRFLRRRAKRLSRGESPTLKIWIDEELSAALELQEQIDEGETILQPSSAYLNDVNDEGEMYEDIDETFVNEFFDAFSVSGRLSYFLDEEN